MRTSLGYFTDIALRRQEGAEVTSHGELTVIRSPQNPTFWWGNFLLFPHAPQAGDYHRWTALFQQYHPSAAHRTFGLNTTDGLTGDIEEFLSHGYQVHRDTVLTAEQTHEPRTVNREAAYRPLRTDADWNSALRLRLAVNAADPQGHEPEGYRVYAARKLSDHRRVQERGKGAMFGALSGQGDVLSLLGLFNAGQGVARYQNVETHPDYRSRGLAGTLVHHAAQWAQRHLLTHRLVIVADPDYHAQALYQSVGFQPTETQVAIQRPPAGD